MSDPTEQQEQVAVIGWLKANNVSFFAPPSSFFSSAKKDKRFFGMIGKLKSAGWSKGFPDLIIFLNGRTVFIEMKTLNTGVVSPAQKAWLEKLRSLGHDAYICKGADAAIEQINKCIQHGGEFWELGL
ncbi:MAG: hypothetical protein DRJ26_05090 [Candidatus Methanomethylicota archaeon]|uniref:VRR-NUC domain-containing protein n=1 Tax=Thermoproteota archaeon TaxID=2056631 RepID=A0A497EZK2_9CREN|nr:MAG: hypothetical protein DRJ26_05090 [Candidatus Verstraetearchaeota archaeon]